MGKSPAKWIKTLLLGKKPSTSNSDLSKGKEKLNSPNKGEVLVSSKVTLSELFANSPSISTPIPVDSASDFVDSEKGIPKLPNNGTNIPSSQAVGNDNAISIFGKPEDAERIRLDRVATKAQAAIRGYLARQAFRTLKGIIRLQALVRGHLVRRQAVATLYCTWGVVKFQALVRGQKVRCSDIDIELQEGHLRLPRVFFLIIINQYAMNCLAILTKTVKTSCLPSYVCCLCGAFGLASHAYHASKLIPINLSKQGLKSSDPFRVCAFSQGSKNKTNNVFVQKLLASSPSVLPLRLQYGPEEPNSLWQWLRRWTSSRFWESPLQVIRCLALKSRTKRSVWKLSTVKVENESCFTLEHENTKCVVRKVSGNTTAVLDHPQNELEKVKRTLKQLTAKDVCKMSEVVDDKTTQTLKRTTFDAPGASEQKSDEKMMREVCARLSTPSSLEADMRLSQEDASLDEPNVSPAVDLAPVGNNDKIEDILVPDELSSKDKQISDVNSKKAKQRRASFPAKPGNVENRLKNTLKLPSYMSPTESVKARLRSQVSPRSAREVIEKKGLNRRYSLPSPSTDSNLSPLSPGAQRPQVASRGDKMVRHRAEWRR